MPAPLVDTAKPTPTVLPSTPALEHLNNNTLHSVTCLTILSNKGLKQLLPLFHLRRGGKCHTKSCDTSEGYGTLRCEAIRAGVRSCDGKPGAESGSGSTEALMMLTPAHTLTQHAPPHRHTNTHSTRRHSPRPYTHKTIIKETGDEKDKMNHRNLISISLVLGRVKIRITWMSQRWRQIQE